MVDSIWCQHCLFRVSGLGLHGSLCRVGVSGSGFTEAFGLVSESCIDVYVCVFIYIYTYTLNPYTNIYIYIYVYVVAWAASSGLKTWYRCLRGDIKAPHDY